MYHITIRQNGAIIEDLETKSQAIKALKDFEQKDKDNLMYEYNFYEIIKTDKDNEIVEFNVY